MAKAALNGLGRDGGEGLVEAGFQPAEGPRLGGALPWNRRASLLFSPNGEAKCVRGASAGGARRLTSAGVLDPALSTASKRN